MKVLLIVMKERRAIIDGLYTAVAQQFELCDIHRLDDGEQADLAGYFARHVDLARYDRVVFLIRFKKLKEQYDFLKTIDKLVFWEFDAYQNYIAVKNAGEYLRLYQRLPWCRVIASGYGVTQRLREDGVDACFVPKGYDHQFLRNLHRPRSTELGFIGSTNNSIYRERVRLLQSIGKTENLKVSFAEPGEPYLNALNDIRFFVSPDKGFGEYMIKNFEAMACGCVLLTYNQGAQENLKIGFKDMDNVVLFRDLEEFHEKLELLRREPGLAENIAQAGQMFVEANYSFDQWAQQVAQSLQAPLREQRDTPAAAVSWWKRILAS